MSITFNGITSDSLGLYVERFPERPFPSRKQTTYQIHGRSGDLIVDENAFSNVTQNYEVYILGGAQGFQAKAKAIANWLLAPAGYCDLVDSYDPTVYRKARFIGGISFVNSLNKFGKATLSFDCCPQRYPSPDEVLTGVLGDTFTIPSTANLMSGYPLISITNWLANDTSGTIVAGGLTITIGKLSATQSIFIDFETRTVFNESGDRVEATISGAWSQLGSGDTIVTTKTTGTTSPAISVKTRRWYL